MQKNKPKVLIAEAEDFSLEVIAKLRKHLYVDIRKCTQDELKNILQEYDAFWFRLGFKIDKTVLSEKSKCKVIATPVTGIDHIEEELCRQLGIKIICLRGEREFLKEVRATAEMAIGLAMGVMRNVPIAFENVKAGHWDRDRFRGNELYKKTMGIIGFGRLGAIVADYANSFGMNVIAVEPRLEAKFKRENVEFVNDLRDIAQRSDVISLHVNYEKETHHLLDEMFFKHCKSNCFFINTSRGGIVKEEALLKALKQKWIKGAALDVLQNEPAIRDDNPLVSYAKMYGNLLIVPHIGGNTYESFEKTEDFIADKLLQFFNLN